MRIATTACLAAAAVLATACNRSPNEPTVGKQVDNAVAKTAQVTKDAALTMSVKTELAREPSLSALSINVDTTDGRVSLRGKAPNAAAVDRATAIARATLGVVSVDNQLVVQPSIN